MAKGFYSAPIAKLDTFRYGDMTGHKIDKVGELGTDAIFYVYDDACPIPVSDEAATFTPITLDASQVALLLPRCPQDVRDLLFPQPDVNGFIQAINGDATIKAQPRALVTLSTLIPMIESDLNVISRGGTNYLPVHFADVVSMYSSDWLTPTIQQLLAAYAAQFHIPLV